MVFGAKLSLRKKFYILVLPTVVALVILLTLLIAPQGQIISQVGSVNENLEAVLHAEEFAGLYERQLMECAGFIASGLAEYERQLEKLKAQANYKLTEWMSTEAGLAGNSGGERSETLEALEETRRALRQIDSACDWAVIAARSGDRGGAAARFEEAAEGPPGNAVRQNTGMLLAGALSRLNESLEKLSGAVQASTVIRVLGDEERTVRSMKAHAGCIDLAQAFDRCYDIQVQKTLLYCVTGSPGDRARAEGAAQRTKEAFSDFGEQARSLASREHCAECEKPFLEVGRKYEEVKGALSGALELAGGGDAAGAVEVVVEATGPKKQNTVASLSDALILSQKRALEENARRISTTSRNITWGVAGLGVLLLALAICGTYFLSRTVVSPVIALTEAARRFGEGGGSIDVEPRGRNEVAELSQTMREMARARLSTEEELRKARDQLEDRVRERTLDLVKANDELKAQIAKRERLEAELRESERKYRELAETLPQVIFELDAEGHVTYVNKSGLEMFGYTSQDLDRGILALQLISEDDRERISRAIGKMMNGRSTKEAREYRARRKDGSTFPCMVYSSLIKDDRGEPAGIRGILTDISEREEMERALKESEARYRFLADNINDLAFVVDLNLNTTYASPSVEKVLGFTPQEQLKRPAEEILTPDSLRKVTRMLAEELEHDLEREPDRYITLEADFYRRDSSVASLETVANFVRDERGKPVGVYGLARDITERKKAEEKLHITQFEVDSAQDEIMRFGSDGRVLYANEAACAAHGYTPQEMTDLTISQLSINFPAEEWEEVWDLLRQMGTMRFDIIGVKKSGEVFPLGAVISYFEYQGSEYLVMFARDISERREAERRLEELNRNLTAINKELDDFAYVVSHDLKAPLRGIGSLATWLASDYSEVLDGEGKRLLGLLLERAKRMESLIDSVLQYSRVGRLRESMESVDAGEQVRSAVEMIGPPDSVRVTVEGELPVILCERTRMAQVFQNLIGNAVKFMDKPQGNVVISCAEEGDFWKFTVADNGPGIDPRYHDTIFDIFQTLARKEGVEGTGVGLTLVKKIVEIHGGRVWVESQPGLGSKFHFTVPKTRKEETKKGNGGRK